MNVFSDALCSSLATLVVLDPMATKFPTNKPSRSLRIPATADVFIGQTAAPGGQRENCPRGDGGGGVGHRHIPGCRRDRATLHLAGPPEIIRTCSAPDRRPPAKKTRKIKTNRGVDKKKRKKPPSKWLPGRKHLILAETGVEFVLVPPA
ncbi:hypothetical protein GWI33_019199 [Rhynchophorus ferrugineus]|uniref:Uncharacterized protein n=1 Tax=Rhynchophorus ferrugineus TaxID=354439 RepID=A0A834M4E4_RHYFE|nr:hypothetical protein GWI33_019199 [Rhynchophorus ferrugineus]